MRQAVGISRKKLAARVGISKAAIQHAENRELEDRVTLATMRKIAEAMGCQLTYAFVPDKPIQELLADQAKQKARKLLKKTDVHMVLEDQKVVSNIEARVMSLADELLAKGDIW